MSSAVSMLARSLAIALVLVGGCAAPDAPAEEEVVDSAVDARPNELQTAEPVCRSAWISLEKGLRHRSHCEEGAATIHLVEIDPKLWTLDAARVSPATAPAVARERRARFAINANFFDPNRKTLGAIVSGGERIQRAHPVSWQSIFYTTAEGESGIVLPDGWPAVAETASMAVQAGPRIVVDGKRTNATRATPSARSGVCLGSDRGAVFFATTGAKLYDVQEIAALAARSEAGGGLGCRDAMLFDGGPSAQMHLDGSPISIEGDVVPAFVLAFPQGERRLDAAPIEP